MGFRTLRPGQVTCVWTVDVESNATELVLRDDEILLEAPNWVASGLLLNGAGTLWDLDLDGQLTPIEIPDLPALNNDHVPAPDGRHVYVSADDGHIYRAPLAGGSASRITGGSGILGLMHFLHGVSPDGASLAFIGLEPEGENRWARASVFTMSTEGGHYRRLTDGSAPADGSEFSPDGAWIYFNTEQFDGHAQIARMRPDGSEVEQLTGDENVNWFPHLSPDGQRAAYISFPPGTEGHPGDLWVEIKVADLPDWGSARTIARIFGGQGSLSVNSWSPDSRSLAFVSYPIEGQSRNDDTQRAR
ncbi:MAG: biopolymer transporter Tol [Leifsonia sp.]|nr:biopolymer transporter Tol [Leifsonia sp.]